MKSTLLVAVAVVVVVTLSNCQLTDALPVDTRSGSIENSLSLNTSNVYYSQGNDYDPLIPYPMTSSEIYEVETYISTAIAEEIESYSFEYSAVDSYSLSPESLEQSQSPNSVSISPVSESNPDGSELTQPNSNESTAPVPESSPSTSQESNIDYSWYSSSVSYSDERRSAESHDDNDADIQLDEEDDDDTVVTVVETVTEVITGANYIPYPSYQEPIAANSPKTDEQKSKEESSESSEKSKTTATPQL